MNEIDFHRALHRPGTIVDAGAHEGRLAVAFAGFPGARVLAFEPFPPSYARLAAAVAQSGLSIETRTEALGAAPGTAPLEVPVVEGGAVEQWASLVKDYGAMATSDARIETVMRVTVPVLPLDALGLTDVTGMKVDVEGAEEEVLRGAADTLRRCRPALSVEIEERHRAGALTRVPALLAGLGYEGFWEFWGEWRPIASFDPSEMQRASSSPADFTVPDPYVFHFWFVPPERRAELAVLARLP